MMPSFVFMMRLHKKRFDHCCVPVGPVRSFVGLFQRLFLLTFSLLIHQCLTASIRRSLLSLLFSDIRCVLRASRSCYWRMRLAAPCSHAMTGDFKEW